MTRNLIQPQRGTAEVDCPVVEGAERIRESYEQYLSDESRMSGELPERIYFPRTTEEVVSAMAAIAARGEKVTVMGSRTGIVGGAVVRHTQNAVCVENLRFKPRLSLNEETGEWTIRIGAGIKLEELLTVLKKKDFDGPKNAPGDLFFPVDPTEQSASLGGMVAANASGARTLFYGATRDWVQGLSVVMADGRRLEISRGEVSCAGGQFVLNTDNGSSRPVEIAPIPMPQTKHVVGYYLKEGMDLVDLFVAGEGTLGIATEIELKLCRRPVECLYLCVFLSAEDSVAELVGAVKASGVLNPIAMEYMDARSLDLLREFRQEIAEASGVPPIADDVRGVLYLEIGFDGDEEFDGIYSEVQQVLGRFGVPVESTWAGFTKKDLDAMKKFRHALPERVNSIIAQRKAEVPELTKVGTDMAVPDDKLGDILKIYYDLIEARGLDFVVFGHIGNAHLHVNILPKSLEELRSAKALYGELARTVVEMRGSVAAEHGIGKLKKDFLKIQYGPEEIQKMKRVKEALDPGAALNPGVLFDVDS